MEEGGLDCGVVPVVPVELPVLPVELPVVSVVELLLFMSFDSFVRERLPLVLTVLSRVSARLRWSLSVGTVLDAKDLTSVSIDFCACFSNSFTSYL